MECPGKWDRFPTRTNLAWELRPGVDVAFPFSSDGKLSDAHGVFSLIGMLMH